MKLKPKTNMTLFKGFIIFLVLFILIIIAVYGFKSNPEIISNNKTFQKVESFFTKKDNQKQEEKTNNSNKSTNNTKTETSN